MMTLLYKKRILVPLVILAFIFFSCGEKPSNPSAFDLEDFPTAPINVKASVGDGVIELSWSHPDVENVKSYYVYRQDSTGAAFEKIGSTELPRYADSNLQNHHEFRYRISALGTNGLEGVKSAIAKAVPGIYGMTINSGNDFTTSRDVVLSLTAPATTSLMKVGNDSLSLGGAQWESFATTRSWTLSEEDGRKIVLVKFRDAEDRETIESYSDDITLDTEAIIRLVTEDSNGRILTANDTIHFAVTTDEAKGRAWIDLPKVQSGIKLFDDGSNGDAVSDDGIYELDYHISVGSQSESAVITGYFTDRAGNVASKKSTASRVTIRRPPTAVTLLSVSSVTSSATALNLFWTINSDDDFASYKIFRSESSFVDAQSPLVTIIQDPRILNYADTTVVLNKTYHYRVYVFDNSGLFSGSNVESGTTVANQPPAPVNLIQVKSVNFSSSSLEIFWRSNLDTDFNNYTIFRSLTPGVSTNSSLVAILQDRSTVSFIDTNLKPSTTYYYRIYVFDDSGLFSGSNEASGTTIADQPPTPVNLVQIKPTNSSSNSLDIIWRSNLDTDFNNYTIFRSLTPGVNTESSLVTILQNQSTVSFTDINLEPNTTYFYRIYVYDNSGLFSGSNEVSGTTSANQPPSPVSLIQVKPTDSSPTSLTIFWTPNSDTDFNNYTLFRSLASGVNTESSLVNILQNQSTVSFTDTDLTPNTTYFYRVYVFDASGLLSSSNELSGTTNRNYPPSPVNLSLPVQIDSLTLRLSWSQSQDQDFASYRLYRSDSSPVDTTSALVIFNNDPTLTQYTDTSVEKDVIYFYRIFVFDKFDLSTGSNEVSGKASF